MSGTQRPRQTAQDFKRQDTNDRQQMSDPIYHRQTAQNFKQVVTGPIINQDHQYHVQTIQN